MDKARQQQIGKAVTLQYLGDALGSSRYFGACPGCRSQFMSMRERVAVIGSQIYCATCAQRKGA